MIPNHSFSPFRVGEVRVRVGVRVKKCTHIFIVTETTVLKSLAPDRDHSLTYGDGSKTVMDSCSSKKCHIMIQTTQLALSAGDGNQRGLDQIWQVNKSCNMKLPTMSLFPGQHP